ncbi:MAG TPA: zinc ribbon domain-containing protein [Candidatus Sumerlaeota bacterium]|nr:MAG: hypothetical protein BWZ08_00937 [candidate division BRC1 bacterium ADurb.BinA292]HOE95953.1 zinc ribbon domain-containing protein [Candidatus Sumerlaeota bacterium]
MRHGCKDQLAREFVCPKCHGHGAHVQEVSVGRAMVNLLPLPANSYLAVTCGLCGYTEFYHLAIAEKVVESASELADPRKLTQKTDP